MESGASFPTPVCWGCGNNWLFTQQRTHWAGSLFNGVLVKSSGQLSYYGVFLWTF